MQKVIVALIAKFNMGFRIALTDFFIVVTLFKLQSKVYANQRLHNDINQITLDLEEFYLK
jgi:hypothetical protein